jgi:hypothetical protein
MSVIETLPPSVEDKEQTRKTTKTVEEQNEIRRSDATTRQNVQNVITQIQFLLCQSCFWCASYIGLSSNVKTADLIKCLICKDGKIESLPIANNERYKFDHNQNYGVMLQFLKR